MILEKGFEVCYLKYCYNGNINSSLMVTTFHSPFSRFGKPKPVISSCLQIEVILQMNVLYLLVRLISVFQG